MLETILKMAIVLLLLAMGGGLMRQRALGYSEQRSLICRFAYAAVVTGGAMILGKGALFSLIVGFGVVLAAYHDWGVYVDRTQPHGETLWAIDALLLRWFGPVWVPRTLDNWQAAAPDRFDEEWAPGDDPRDDHWYTARGIIALMLRGFAWTSVGAAVLALGLYKGDTTLPGILLYWSSGILMPLSMVLGVCLFYGNPRRYKHGPLAVGNFIWGAFHTLAIMTALLPPAGGQ